MNNKYSIVVKKDEQCVKHHTDNDIDIIMDYFRIYNSPDYEVSIVDLEMYKPIAYKDKGIQL